MSVSMVSTTLHSDPHRSRKFNGDKREEHLKEDVSAENKSPLQLQNGCTEEVKNSTSTEKPLKEHMAVTCASQDIGEPENNTGEQNFTCKEPEGLKLPASAMSLDENSNVLDDKSDSKEKSPCAEDGGRPVSLCPVISSDLHETNATKPQGCEEQPGNASVNSDDHAGDARETDVTTKSAKEDILHLLKNKERGCSDKKSDKGLREDDTKIKKKGIDDRREKKEKTDHEKDKLRGKTHHSERSKKDQPKKESESNVSSCVDKKSTQEKLVVGSITKGETATEGKPTKSSKPKDETEKRHKDHAKSKDRGPGIGEDKYKRHSEKGKTENKDHIKKEAADVPLLVKELGNNLKGNTVTLVDLDLFQIRPTDDRKQRAKDKAKGKSHEKVIGKAEEKDKQKKDHKDKKMDKDAKKPKEDHKKESANGNKGEKRELEDHEEESEAVHKKSKHGPVSNDKPLKVKQEEKDNAKKDKTSASKKRKNKDEGEVREAKKTKEGKQKEAESKWKWWEEDNYEDGVKWKFLEHRGPYFAPPYEPLPDNVRFSYDGQPLKLSLAAEEVATFYGKMLDHEYTSKEVFQKNFFTDWKSQMTKEESKTIKHLYKCDFSEIHKYFFEKNEARKALPKEEKQKLKEETSKIQDEYGYCMLDGHREKIGNFKTEPPGLFRGRGDHPKMGMLKMRIEPEDVIINCSQDSKVPEPPPGRKWKEVRCDNTVTWLASWTENIQSSIKYIMLNPSSKLKGEKDWQKYETARRLKGVVDQIRSQYRIDWKSREMKKRQRAVALYFIDKLALRAGNEKEEGETADTVGCCSLRVEHIKLFPELDGQKYVVEFDFLGKDSIRYYNKLPVEKEVFKNLKLFMENKDPEDDLFDRLNTSILNKHLQDLMEGLTAKVFRTYNASITLQMQLKELTNEDDNVAAKILSYNRANRAVALLCNHQRALPKTYEKSMQNLQAKIDAKEEQLKDAKKELKKAKADHKARNNDRTKKELEKKKKQCERLAEQLMKLKLQATDKEENKQVALGTSKLNYLDPRITVAWIIFFVVSDVLTVTC
ncbi:DNA topoisomerase I, mitochondrial isoform X2 [Pseudophryne corroboree]|uniref:DNA topoisomerase I, mitochondrial isoform X2 n=1 Tax=Pseudophryne corroboree TaxID=495146 RepID=UPI003081984B